jgi:predicted ester cyclase
MSVEANKEIGRRWGEEVWGKSDIGAVDQLAHPDITVAYPLMPEPTRGREAFKEVLRMLQAALPDVYCSVDEVIAEGDKVVARWTMGGTQTGPFGSIPPTGNRVRWTGISIMHIAEGKVLEDRGEEDALGLMQQLGVVLKAEPAAAWA